MSFSREGKIVVKKDAAAVGKQASNYKQNFSKMDSFSKHNFLIGRYYRRNVAQREPVKTDMDVLRENHQFLWDDDEVDSDDLKWGQKLAKSYYDKLFKEYCITDLRHYKENKIAMRWRTEKEVISGKGQFICAEKQCNELKKLQSWEVNFGYRELDQDKNALIKIRLCPLCSLKINYHKKHKPVTKTSRKRSQKNKNPVESTQADQVKEEDELAAEDDQDQNNKEFWKTRDNQVDKTNDEEFDQFLDDLFM